MKAATTNGKAPASDEGLSKSYSRPHQYIPAFDGDKPAFSERAEALYNCERDAKRRLRDAITACGLRRRRARTDYGRFESLKSAWLAAHPKASSVEIQAAVRRIAAACGV